MPSEAFLREPVVVGRSRRIADEVAEFANAEAAASGLPGHVNGPRDAYRHLVGVGELSRRIGVIPASILAEYNEQISDGRCCVPNAWATLWRRRIRANLAPWIATIIVWQRVLE